MSEKRKPRKIIFLSGLLCDDTMWQPLLQQYRLRDFKTDDQWVTLSFPDSDSIEDMAKIAFYHLGEAENIVIGHSMGARVAMALYQFAPARISKMALLDFGVHPKKPNEEIQRQRLIDQVEMNGMEYLIDHWLKPMTHPLNIEQAQIFEPMKKMVLSKNIEILKNQIAALLNRPNAEEVFKSISIPLYLGVGREDQWSTLQQHQQLLELNQNAQLHIYEHSGHMSPIEAVEQLSHSLEKWLGR